MEVYLVAFFRCASVLEKNKAVVQQRWVFVHSKNARFLSADFLCGCSFFLSALTLLLLFSTFTSISKATKESQCATSCCLRSAFFFSEGKERRVRNVRAAHSTIVHLCVMLDLRAATRRTVFQHTEGRKNTYTHTHMAAASATVRGLSVLFYLHLCSSTPS